MKAHYALVYTIPALLLNDNAVAIHRRNLQKLATEMYKIITNHSSALKTNPY